MWYEIVAETEKRVGAAEEVLLHSVWVEGPEGRGFTRGKPESSEFNFKIRGDDPTFRESLRRRA